LPEQALATVCDRLLGGLAHAGVKARRLSAADIHAWLLRWFNPNPTLDSLRAIPTQVAPFPAFTNAQGQPNPCSANPFGLAFSCDAVHPSAATHRILARHLVLAINAKYGSAIPAVP